MAAPSSPRTSADTLARAYLAARIELRQASRILHDEVGSLLAVAGLRLQMLRMDHPNLGERASEIGEALEGVMETIRALSRKLDPSPAGRTGLKNALFDLGENCAKASGRRVVIRTKSTAKLPVHIADAIYDVVAHALDAAASRKGVTQIGLSATGVRTIVVRIEDNGSRRRSSRDLELASVIARNAGLDFEVATRKGTIVSIRYAMRRTPR